MGKIGVLLVNLGTPDSTKVSDVRKYLREFLMDKRVVDIPYVLRWILVNLIIAIFRAPKSAAEYRKLFTGRGSPLKFYTEDLTAMVQKKLARNYAVEFGMRYQSPSIEEAIKRLMDHHVSEIKVIPLFPQYASATTGSVIDKVMELTKQWQIIPKISFVSQFFHHPLLIETIVDQAQPFLKAHDYDHYLFSYHGLPERQIRKGSVDKHCKLGSCCAVLGPKNQFCYRAQCFETTRLIADKMKISEDNYTVCFQSRLGRDEWIKPYAEDTLKKLAADGKKSILVFSPAFVSDCLETTIEVGEEYKENFIEAGGMRWDLVPSLNTESKWVDCVVDMVK
jgi:ferrochelatase